MLFGLGWPQWLTIIAMVGALWLTFKVMARGSIAYERKRQAREAAAMSGSQEPEQGSIEEGEPR